MNLVEAWFGILTKTSIRRGSFPSVAALLKHIRAYIAHWNEHKKAVRRSVNKTSRSAD